MSLQCHPLHLQVQRSVLNRAVFFVTVVKSQRKQSHLWPIRTRSQIMRPVPSAGRQLTGAKRGKGREVQPV